MLPRHSADHAHVPKYDEVDDPLGEYTDSFNILQFISDSDTVDSPSPAMRQSGSGNNNGALLRPQLNQQQNAIDPVHMMFHPSTRLPDSPPITDISGAGSSGSPSSNSDSPYSPDSYPNYSVLPPQQNNGGLILGVQDLQNPMLPHDLMHSQVLGQRLNPNSMPSPPSVGFMSPYQSQPTPASVSQVSPPSNGNMRGGYMMSNNYDMYQSLLDNDGSMTSQGSEAPMSRKRQRDQPPTPHIGNFPGNVPIASPIAGDFGDENYHQQVIRFTRFNEEQWNPLFDANRSELQQLQVHVVADKGFNYSNVDGCFVNQKKNHFQISVNIEANDALPPRYVKINNCLHPVKGFKLAFCGVKSEMTSSEIQIKQSQTDRKPVPHEPVELEIHERRMTKVTVPRLHFSETTMNNQRKNFRPNPDQKYFLLLVRLLAETQDGHTALVQAYQSEKVIVRATNPGQFEPPNEELKWNQHGDTLYTEGKVAINMSNVLHHRGDLPALSVGGDIHVSGNIIKASDRRLKENIIPVSRDGVLDRIQNVEVVTYDYKPDVVKNWGLSEEQAHRMGVIAQDLAAVIPDAVREGDEFLTIDESRLYYETLLATQELCRLTGNLDEKIEQKVADLSARLQDFARRRRLASSLASMTTSGFGDKSLSQSRASLAPSMISGNGMTQEKRHHKSKDRHGTCHNPHCHSRDTPLCSSKLTQGTIVTLVVVMAACLISMSALYVLDWHNRNYGHYHHLYPPVTTTPPKSSTEGVGMMMVYQMTPPRPKEAPPLMGYCESSRCQTYCCGDRSVFYQTGAPDEDIEFVGLEQQRSPIVKRRSFAGAVGPSGVKKLPSGVGIEIVGHNITLDERYCIEGGCQKKRGRYNLVIPVSPLLPTASLLIQFHAPRGKFVNNCGFIADFSNEICSYHNDPYKKEDFTRAPTSEMVTENVFEVSAGAFSQSAYRFRVGVTTESCFSNEDHLYGSYEEYNLIFVRTCKFPPGQQSMV